MYLIIFKRSIKCPNLYSICIYSCIYCYISYIIFS
nr:MAG TPA: hypothetical protein [Bacteriophage sp.]